MILPIAVLFDLDGTLIDSSDIVVEAYYQALITFGFDVKDKNFIASLAGKSTFDTARALGVPESGLAKIDKFFWDYFGKYAKELTHAPKLFPGIQSLVEKFVSNNIKLGICTSNEAQSAKILMNKANLDQFFDAFVGSEDSIANKPSPEPIFLALKRMEIDINGLNFQKIWFIGDTKYDILAAKAAGVVSIGIPQKYTKKELIAAEPDFLADTALDFLEFINEKFS